MTTKKTTTGKTSKVTAETEAKNAIQVLDEDGDPLIEQVEFTVTINKREYEITAPASIMDASAEAYIAFEQQNIGVMLKETFGPAQWNMLLRAGLRTRDMIETLWPAYQEAMGVGEG